MDLTIEQQQQQQKKKKKKKTTYGASPLKMIALQSTCIFITPSLLQECEDNI